MRGAVLLFGLLAVGAGGARAGAAKMKRVAGTAVRSHSICGGGAAITQEHIDRLPPPEPIAGKEFLVVAGARVSASKPVARFTTRGDGTFVARLPRGTWCFFEAGREPEEEKGPPGPPSSGIPDCLAEERLRCDLVLEVTSDVRAVRIVFTERCHEPWAQPCYHGPMPP